MQRERDRTTLGLSALLVTAAVIGNPYPLISVPLIGLGLFLLAWGRNQRRIDAFIGRLPAGSYLLKVLNHLDAIISPVREQRAKRMLHKCYVEICDLFNETVSQEHVGKYIDRVNEAFANQAKRIENELGEIARVKFLDRTSIINNIFDQARGNREYNTILLEIDRVKNNLEDLIKSDNWWAE
jgi:hypothetical protein